jgi:protein-disulfide isomerase
LSNSGARLTKNDKREAAREQARIQREEQKKKDRRNKWFLQGGLILGSLAIIALVTMLIINGTKPAGPGPLNMASDGIQIGQGFVAKSTPALKAGEEPVPNERDESGEVIDIQMYIDYQCPFCQSFELTNGDYLAGLVENGGATVEIHPIAMLDNASLGKKYSTRATNAAACVANFSPNLYWDFNRILFENQPAEGTEGLTDEQLISLTEDAGVDDADQVAQCITDQTFKGWVAAAKARALSGPLPNTDVEKVIGTPTVLVNGVKYEGPVDDAATFAAFVVQVAGDSFSENSTPTPTPTPTETPAP